MKPEPLYAGDGISAAAGLFALAGAVFVVTLFCPVVVDIDGLLYHRWPGLFANLTLLTTALFGRELRHRHALPMLMLAINGLVAGLIMPAMSDGRLFFPDIWTAYGQLKIEYWLWIAALTLVAAGWWSVVWRIKVSRRQVRRALPGLLFAATGIVFAIALCSPAIRSSSTHVMPGYDAFLMTIGLTFSPWLRIEFFGSSNDVFISIPTWLTLIMGTFANLTLIMSVVAGLFLRRRAVGMCYVSACGLLAGLLMPIVGVTGGMARGNLSDMYDGALYYGYWLWIAALALHAIAWGDAARNQQQSVRLASIELARVQRRDELPSGESN